MQFSFLRLQDPRPASKGRWEVEIRSLVGNLEEVRFASKASVDCPQEALRVWYLRILDLITSQETVRTWQDLIARILPSTACRVRTKQNRQAVMPSNYRCSVFLLVACLLDDWICFKWQHIFCQAHVLTRRGGKRGHLDHPGLGWFRL